MLIKGKLKKIKVVRKKLMKIIKSVIVMKEKEKYMHGYI